MKALFSTLKETYQEFTQDRALRLSAATAYYAVFSLGPLLVLIIGLAGLVFSEARVKQQVGDQLASLVGPKSAQMVQNMMSAQQKTGSSVAATIVGFVGLVLGAAGVFGQLQDSLNTIWGVVAKPAKGLWPLIRDRFFSMAMVLGVGFLLLISMVLSTAVQAFSGYLSGVLSVPQWVPPLLQFALSVIVITLLFALIFKVLPDAKVPWKYVWIGALGTTILFSIGKFLLGLYLQKQAATSPYGAASSLIIVLLYIYYSTVILYFGAEFTQVYARRHGAGIQPSKYAVQITDEERAHQGMPRQEQIEDAARRSEEQPRRPSNPPEASKRPHPGKA